MRFVNLLFYCLVYCSVSGCAQKHHSDSFISGVWLITLTTIDAGKLQVVMNFETDDIGKSDSIEFHAYSEKDMDRKVLGNFKARLGRMAGSNFKDGSLLRLTKGQVLHRDSITGILVSPFGNYHFNANITGNQMSGALSNGNYEVVGYVTGTKGQPQMPLNNYSLIVDSALKVAENKLYDPALLKTVEWQDFKNEIKRVSTITGDDAALVMAFFYYARKLSFSHFALYVPSPGDSDKITGIDNDLMLSEKTRDIAYLKINSFGGTSAAMESVFRKLGDKQYSTLIVDLRGNPGGSIEAGMTFARHFLTDTLFAGVLLTQKYFRSHTALPLEKDYHEFPSFSEANSHLLLNGISEYFGICLKGYPAAPLFRGKVYILTDKQTASTCEPIVYALKQHALATIVGQTTAGAMLNGESFSVGHGYTITVPTATYYTSDGLKIDQQGVAPNIVLKDEDALSYVLKQIADPKKHD